MSEEYQIIRVQKKMVELQRLEAEKKRKLGESKKNNRQNIYKQIRKIILIAIVIAACYQLPQLNNRVRNRLVIAGMIIYLGWRRISALKR